MAYDLKIININEVIIMLICQREEAKNVSRLLGRKDKQDKWPQEN